MSQLRYLKHDLYRYLYPRDKVDHISFLKALEIILFTQGIWAIVVYRLRRWVHVECRSTLLKIILKPILRFCHLGVQTVAGISIGDDIDIGPGLYIGHFGNIFVGGNTSMGKFCNISHGNTVGWSGRGSNYGQPKIGDFVYIAPGAKLIGNISIGNNVAIGANSVVMEDVPDNAVMIGIPAKAIHFFGSKAFVQYNREKHKEILS